MVLTLVAGPCLNVNTAEAHPVVYGREEDEFRPRMPPEHIVYADERENALQYMEHIAGTLVHTATPIGFDAFAAWQGNQIIIDWQTVESDLSQGGNTYIDPARLPANRPSMRDPLSWTELETRKMTKHFREHQARLDAGDKSAESSAFQWRTIFESPATPSSVDETFRKHIHPQSSLEYATSSAMYYARLCLEQDAVLTRSPAFIPEVRRHLVQDNLLDGTIAELVEAVERMESVDQDPVCRPREQLVQCDLMEPF